MSRILITFLIFSLGGCANFYPPVSKRELGDAGYWVNYDSARRGAVVLKKETNGTSYAYCAEQAPDVAMTLVNKISGDIKAGGATTLTNLDAEATATAVQLAGRTQLVLLTRESLYRLCEISMNRNLDQATMLAMLKEMNLMITAVANNEIAQANKEAEKTRTEAITKATQAANNIPDAVQRSEQVQQILKSLPLR